MRNIILPGEEISDQPMRLSNTYVENGKTYASVVGMLDEEGRYTPLESVYSPRPGDTVVGIVVDVRHHGFVIDVNLSSNATLPARDTRLRLEMGDLVFGKIGRIFPSGDIDLQDVRKLSGGKIFDVPTAKVPRIIGKKSSMLDMIRESTNTKIVVGNNGYIWISEQGNIPLVMKVIEYIVENAHKKGLTDKMSEFIKKHME
ncbi:hypothetical protein JXB01_00210 [Candidatus Micrarchaeota archaeon]|nr:hypothetical protein [Candidatus Micrarchaeota archaeon]